MQEKPFSGYVTVVGADGTVVNVPSDIYLKLKGGELNITDLRCFSKREREAVMEGKVVELGEPC